VKEADSKIVRPYLKAKLESTSQNTSVRKVSGLTIPRVIQPDTQSNKRSSASNRFNDPVLNPSQNALL